MCPVTDAATGETRDVDLLQELILNNGLIDVDWFSIDPKKRLRRWLLPERRLALRQWEAGDTVEVRGLKSASELNGRMAVVKAYLPKQRRFQCELVAVVVVAESGTKPEPVQKKKKGRRKKKGKKKKAKKPKPVALRAENLVVRFCKACGKHGTTKLQACGACRLAHYCGAGCQKSGWRRHKAFCKYAQKEAKKSKAQAADAAQAAAVKAKAKAAKLAAAAVASGSGGAGVGSGRGGGSRGIVRTAGPTTSASAPRATASWGVRLRMTGRSSLMLPTQGDLKEVKRLLAKGVDIEHAFGEGFHGTFEGCSIEGPHGSSREVSCWARVRMCRLPGWDARMNCQWNVRCAVPRAAQPKDGGTPRTWQ